MKWMISRNQVPKALLILVLTAVLGFSIYCYFGAKEASDRSSLPGDSGTKEKEKELVTFLASIDMEAQERKKVEVFDIQEGRVVKQVTSNPTIQGEAEKFLGAITGLYVKVNAIPSQGFIVRIPLEPPVRVQNQWLDDLVEEVFVLFPKEEKPYLLVLDDRKRPFFYNFEGSTDKLLDSLGYAAGDSPAAP